MIVVRQSGEVTVVEGGGGSIRVDPQFDALFVGRSRLDLNLVRPASASPSASCVMPCAFVEDAKRPGDDVEVDVKTKDILSFILDKL